MKLEAVAYLRVSSVNQLEGNGFERQEKAISKYARSKYSLTNVYKEQGVSGTITDRPALMTMMTDLIVNNRPKVVLVESADRLGRSLEVSLTILSQCRKHGIQVIAVDSGTDLTDDRDPMTEALTLVQGVFAQLDKRRLVAKLSTARQAKRLSTGRCEGRLPYGSKEGEPAGLLLIKTMTRAKHGTSAIARALTEAGHPTRTGTAWSRQAVHAIVTRLKS